jgi:hypothetical protein
MDFSEFSKQYIETHKKMQKLNDFEFNDEHEMSALQRDIMFTRGEMNNFLDSYRNKGIAVFDNKLKLNLNGQTEQVIAPMRADIKAVLKEVMPENSYHTLASKKHDMVILVDSRNDMAGRKVMEVIDTFKKNHSIDSVIRTCMIPSPSNKETVFDLKSAKKVVYEHEDRLLKGSEMSL